MNHYEGRNFALSETCYSSHCDRPFLGAFGLTCGLPRRDKTYCFYLTDEKKEGVVFRTQLVHKDFTYEWC